MRKPRTIETCPTCRGTGERTVQIHGRPAIAVCNYCGGSGRVLKDA